MNENQCSRELRKSIQAAYENSYVLKMVGHPYLPAGVPDLLGYVNRRFIGIEAKLIRKAGRKQTHILNGLLTEDQILNLEQIQRTGGLARAAIFIGYRKPMQCLLLSPLAYRHMSKNCTQADLCMFLDCIHFATGVDTLIRQAGGVWNVQRIPWEAGI